MAAHAHGDRACVGVAGEGAKGDGADGGALPRCEVVEVSGLAAVPLARGSEATPQATPQASFRLVWYSTWLLRKKR